MDLKYKFHEFENLLKYYFIHKKTVNENDWIILIDEDKIIKWKNKTTHKNICRRKTTENISAD